MLGLFNRKYNSLPSTRLSNDSLPGGPRLEILDDIERMVFDYAILMARRLLIRTMIDMVDSKVEFEHNEKVYFGVHWRGKTPTQGVVLVAPKEGATIDGKLLYQSKDWADIDGEPADEIGEKALFALNLL